MNVPNTRIDAAVHHAGANLLQLLRQANTDRFSSDEHQASLPHEALLKGILESTADGIVAFDRQGKLIQANRRFSEMWGFPQPLLDGSDDQALLDFALTQLNDPQAFLNRAQANYGSAVEDLYELTFKDGRIIKHFSAPLLLNGSIHGRVWSFCDVTKRKQAENGLRDEEELFRGLVEQAMTGIIIIQEDKLAYVNPRFCEIHGYAQQHELVGADPLALIAEKDRRATLETIRRLLDGEESHINHNLTALRQDGSTVEIGVCSSRASYRGQPAIFAMLQDISGKIRSEEDSNSMSP